MSTLVHVNVFLLDQIMLDLFVIELIIQVATIIVIAQLESRFQIYF